MSVIKNVKKEIITPKKMGLLVENPVYKPFRYPWCYDAWLTQQRIHWLPEEVPLGDDVRDWQKNLSQAEKNSTIYQYICSCRYSQKRITPNSFSSMEKRS